MNWSKRKTLWFDNLLCNLYRSNTLSIASTQTPARKSRHRKYHDRFNRCLKELLDKYPPYPAYDSSNFDSNIAEKLFQTREDLIRLTQILEDLDKRLDALATSTEI